MHVIYAVFIRLLLQIVSSLSTIENVKLYCLKDFLGFTDSSLITFEHKFSVKEVMYCRNRVILLKICYL